MLQKYQSFIEEEIAKRIKANGRYSIRAFARDLRISPSYLCQVLHQKRQLSTKRAWQMASLLNWSESKKKHFLALVECSKSQDKTLTEALLGPPTNDCSQPFQHAIANDEFELIASWENFTILELISLTHQKWDAPQIAKQLKLTILEVEKSLIMLEKVGLVAREAGSRSYRRTHIVYGFQSKKKENLDHATHQHHLGQIKRLQSRFRSMDPSTMKLENITVALDSKKIPLFKSMIYEYAQALHLAMLTDSPDKVYQLSLYFYPQT